MPLLSSSLLIQSLGFALLTLSTLLILTPERVLTSPTIALLGSSMHIRPATYIPDALIPPHLLPESHSNNNNPFYVPLVRPKKSLALSEKELLGLFALLLSLVAVGMNILAYHLRYSKSGLTSFRTAEGRIERKPSMKVAGDVKVITATQELWQVLCAVNVVVSSGLVAWIYLVKTERYGGVLSEQSLGEGWDVLANNIVFTFGLSNMLFWGYIFTVVKEERREVLLVLQRRQEEDEEDAVNLGEVR